jgi:Phage integrase, N-terminal SAM-like domain/Phage integrase family
MAHIQKRARNGKPAYVARYLDPEGQERSRSFRTEREAERFLIQVEAAKLSSSYLDPAASRLTFNQWADQWWQVWAADLDRSPTTLGAADSRLRCHLRPTFGRRRLDEITASSIRQWQYELRGKELEHGTVMACRSLLNRILQAAEDERLIPANPVAKVPPPKRPVDPEVIFGRVEPRVYTAKQVGQLLAYAAPEDRGVLLVLIGTGLRAGELCGLRSARVDLGRRRVEVATVRYDAGRFGRGYKPRPKAPPASVASPSPPWWSRSCGVAALGNGPRCCSRMHPGTACGMPTCGLSAGRGRRGTCSAWTCAVPMTSGTPSRPGWRTTASRHE